MQRLQSFPVSTVLSQFIDSVCPMDQHMNVVSLEVWADNEYDGHFSGLFMEQDTTYVNIIRHFIVKGESLYTLEKWEHDNGYRCTMSFITKAEYDLYITLTGVFLQHNELHLSV